MITFIKNELYEVREGVDKYLVEITCTTSDTKPTDNIKGGSICFNMETSTFSMFDEDAGDWLDLE